MDKDCVDICVCGCKQEICVGDTCYTYDDYRFKSATCIVKYVGAKEEVAEAYKTFDS